MVHQGLIACGRRDALRTLGGLGMLGTLGTVVPLGGCALPGADRPPPLPREFRAAWVATVANIDWPSRPGLPTAEARAEMIRLLDAAQAAGLNALVLQVRPAADALYPSDLEPWSEYLTGAQGRAPEVAWDPLAEWVDGAHRRGLELHAWFNPYRARHPSARSELAASHVANARPSLVKRYGEWLWMDPGEPASADRMLAVVADVVRRYDVDGVHLDDYFYPYPVNGTDGQPLPFPDDPSWQRHGPRGDAGQGADRAAWRRANVDRLIERLYREVHALKPWVRVGISPFGLPRPANRPPGITGFSQYDALHADVERWTAEGWLDYLAPQLYWARSQTAQAFDVLLDTWRGLNPRSRHLWPGLFTSRIGAERNPYDAAEVLAQVLRSREGAAAGAAGHLHFSLVALAANRDGVAERLRQGPYAEATLPPATPWLAEPEPQAPRLDRRADGWWPLQGPGAPLRTAVLWQRTGAHWRWQALPLPATRPFERAADAQASLLVGLGRTGLESTPVRVESHP